jgi:hypothetical protein
MKSTSEALDVSTLRASPELVRKYQIYEYVPLPVFARLRTEDTSGFQDAYDFLISQGLIPKRGCGVTRSPGEIISEPLGWQVEDCCTLPVPGKEGLGMTAYDGWGIYRAIFSAPFLDLDKPFADVNFRYFYIGTDREDFVANRVFERNPMAQHIKEVIRILRPFKVEDHERNLLDFSRC